MNSFLVLSPGLFMDQSGLEVTVKAFALLFHKVTPKHQRRLKLVLIEEKDKIPGLRTYLNQQKIHEAAKIIDREDIQKVESAYETATMFLYSSVRQNFKIIEEALSFGLPILTFESPDTKLLLDNTCSMLLRKRMYVEAYEEFSKMLEMLYFDPEVNKMLSKGAKYKYEHQLQWGLQSRRGA